MILLALLLQAHPPINYPTAKIDGGDVSTVIVKNRRQGPGKLAKRVGKLAANGQCDEARAMALKGGDFTLAQQAEAMCRR